MRVIFHKITAMHENEEYRGWYFSIMEGSHADPGGPGYEESDNGPYATFAEAAIEANAHIRGLNLDDVRMEAKYQR